MKRSPLRRHPRKDPVTPELRQAVLERDQGCVAPRLGAVMKCQGRLTLDHVREQPMMGKRAPSDMAHLITLCEWHHLEGWATSHRPELRAHLAELNGFQADLAEALAEAYVKAMPIGFGFGPKR